MGMDVAKILAEVGVATAEGPPQDPALADLAEALAYPLRMGTGALTPEAADAVQAETGIPASMLAGLTGWAMGSAARGLAQAPNEEAWRYVARITSALARVRGWEPAAVADGIYAETSGENPGLYQLAEGLVVEAQQKAADVGDQAADVGRDEVGTGPLPFDGEPATNGD